MSDFICIERYGQLWIDQIFFESYIPIIFSCKDKNNNTFISVCCQSNKNGKMWLIGKTEPARIIDLLQENISVRELLADYCSDKIIATYKDGEYSVAFTGNEWGDVNSKYLPKEDSYMDSDPGEFEDEIKYFRSLMQIKYPDHDYKCIEDLIESIDLDDKKGLNELSLVTDETIICTTPIPSEIINILETVYTLQLDTDLKTIAYHTYNGGTDVYDRTINTVDKISVTLSEEISNRSLEAA